MNRRRFLSMLGLFPAALALPPLPQVEARKKVTFNFVPSRNVDLQWISLMSKPPMYLVGESGPEIFIPPQGSTEGRVQEPPED